MLRKNMRLERLGLAENYIGGEGAGLLCDALEQPRKVLRLERICVFGNPLCGDGVLGGPSSAGLAAISEAERLADRLRGGAGVRSKAGGFERGVFYAMVLKRLKGTSVFNLSAHV